MSNEQDKPVQGETEQDLKAEIAETKVEVEALKDFNKNILGSALDDIWALLGYKTEWLYAVNVVFHITALINEQKAEIDRLKAELAEENEQC